MNEKQAVIENYKRFMGGMIVDFTNVINELDNADEAKQLIAVVSVNVIGEFFKNAYRELCIHKMNEIKDNVKNSE